MKEREEEYHAEMTAKLNVFIMEHAARVIQFAWREVLANRAEKKKVWFIKKCCKALNYLKKKDQKAFGTGTEALNFGYRCNNGSV